MTRRFFSWLTTTTLAGTMLLMLALGASMTTAAPRDRTPPTTPTNLRVTGTTSYSVSLAWNPSTDNSGSFSYVICCAYTNSATVGQTATSFTFTAGLEAGRTFTFRIYAVDAAGNASRYSNSVTVTLPADTRPPTKPVVSVSDVGPTHVSLAWSSTDDGPNVWFWVFVDGNPIIQGTKDRVGTIYLLDPQTTHAFTVRARDFGGNLSPLSDALTVTTEPSNPNDTTPPTTPGNLSESHWDDGEIHLGWDESTDDLDPQWIIRYDIYVNGVFDHSTVGRGQSIVYGVAGRNTVSVIAVDTAGNESAPATITIDL